MAGRPPGEKSFAAALRLAINQAGTLPGETRLRDVAEQLVQQAEQGELAAIKEIADRLDGKPVQQNENNNVHEVGDSLIRLMEQVNGRTRSV